MVKVRVYKPKEYEEAAYRAYASIDKTQLRRIHTQTELQSFMDREYFNGKAVPKLLTKVGRIFEDKGWWDKPEVKVPFPEVETEPRITEKPIKIDKKEYKKVKKAEKKPVKLKLEKPVYDEEFVISYVDKRPSVGHKGKIYKVTKKKKLIKRSLYIKKMKNLAKGWRRKKTGKSKKLKTTSG